MACLVIGIAGGCAHRADTNSDPANDSAKADQADPWEVSYRGDEVDLAGNTLWGNAVMAMVPFHGRLYASTGVECDKADDPDNPAPLPIPNPIVMSLNRSHGRWQLDANLGQNPNGGPPIETRVGSLLPTSFRTDGQGHTLSAPADLLVAAVGSSDTCSVWTGTDTGGATLSWAQTTLPVPCNGSSGRAMAQFRDQATGVDRIFLALASPGRGAGDAIYSGVYDPTAPGSILWDTTPETPGIGASQHRVMSFAAFNGQLFATSATTVWQRTSTPSANVPVVGWSDVWDYSGPTPLPIGAASSGLRGLTAIPGTAGSDGFMLAVMEGNPGDTLRLQPTPSGISVEHETALWQLLAPLPFEGGVTAAGLLNPNRPDPGHYIIAAFNNILEVKRPLSQARVSLIGMEDYNEFWGHELSAWFAARDGAAGYTLHEIPKLPLRPGIDQPLDPDIGLRAVRSFAVSPFLEDDGHVLFAGGFDPVFPCGVGQKGPYNLRGNGWIYRAGITTALQESDTVIAWSTYHE
jgi:hypothetical protein